MAATPAQIAALISYAGAREDADTEFAAAKYAEAQALVDQYIGPDYLPTFPEEIRSQQILEVGAKLWNRKAAPFGQMSFSEDGAPLPTPRDPMITAYPVLDRFLPGGFA